MFRKDVHVAKSDIAILPDAPIYVGIDFGLTPACVFGMKIRSRWVILDELVAEDMGIRILPDFDRVEFRHFIGNLEEIPKLEKVAPEKPIVNVPSS